MSDSPTSESQLEESARNSGNDSGAADREIDPTITIRNEGQRLLLAVGASLGEVATRIGSAKNRVSEWRRGHRTPPADLRKKLEAEYGIPVHAWTQLHEDPADSADADETSTTIETVNARLASIAARRRSGRLSPADLAKLDQVEVQLLRLRAKLESDARTLEYRIVREHPAFTRATALILAALAPHPEAARAVADALHQLDVEHGEESA